MQHFKRGVLEQRVQDKAHGRVVQCAVGVCCVLGFGILISYWIKKSAEDDDLVGLKASSNRAAYTPGCFCLPAGQLLKRPRQSSSASAAASDEPVETTVASTSTNSSFELWSRIIAVYLACILAPGVLPIWSVVQPLFTEAGVFGNSCGDGELGCEEQESLLSLAYLTAFALMLIFTWPVGLVFDHMGPRSCSALGALMCMFAQIALVIAVEFPGSFSWLLFIGAIFADLGGMMNGFALFGFLWHEPERQGLITGLSDSSSAAGTLVALIFVSIMPFRTALMFMVLTAGISSVLCWFLAPTLEEFNREAAKIWNLDGLRAFRQKFGFQAAWTLVWRAAKDKALGRGEEPGGYRYFTSRLWKCWRIFCINWYDNLYFTLSLVALLSFYCYFTSIQSPYLAELLHSKGESAKVCDFGASMYGIVGLLLGPASGWISDTFGVKALVIAVAIMNTIQVTCIFFPYVPVQMFGALTGAAFAALYITYGTRWFVLYAPPDQFGNYSGCIFSVCGILSMVVCLLTYTVSKLCFTGLALYVVPLAVLGSGCVISMNWFIWHIHNVEIQKTPPVLEDES